MLSRAAERVYWTGRFLERAENTARIVQQYSQLLLDLPPEVGVEWGELIAIFGATRTYADSGGGDEDMVLNYGKDQVIWTRRQVPEVALEDSEMVFVGYGIQAPEEDWDDFKDVDLSGKILLMLNDVTDWDPELFAGDRKLSYGRWTYKYTSAAAQGAAGAIIIHTTESAGYPWSVVRASNIGEQFELVAGDEPRTLFNGWLTWEGSKSLAEIGGHDLLERHVTVIPPGIDEGRFSPVRQHDRDAVAQPARRPTGRGDQQAETGAGKHGQQAGEQREEQGLQDRHQQGLRVQGMQGRGRSCR